MSKKTSPSVGPTRRPRSRPAGQSTEASSRPGGRIRKTSTPTTPVEVEAPDPTWRTRLRKFLPVALFPNGLALGVVIAIAIIALLVTSTPMGALAATIAQSWLVVNAVPVVGMGYTFGFLPLLPAALLAMGVSARVHKAIKDRVSLMDLGMLSACVLGVPVVLTLMACGTLLDASAVYEVSSPNVAIAVARTLLLHLVALVVGMGIRLWRALARRFGIPEWMVDQAINAAKMLNFALIASTVVFIGSIIFHYETFVDILALYQGWGAVAAIVLSILYLPNIAIATLAVAAGGEFVIGEGMVTIFNVDMVPLPPLPLLAGIPATAHPAALVLLVIAPLAAVFALVKHVPRLVEIPVFVGFVMLFSLVLSVFTRGQLGVYGSTGPNVFLATGFLGLWAFIVGVIIGVVGVLLPRRAETTAAEETTEPEENKKMDLAAEEELDAEVGDFDPELADEQLAEVVAEEAVTEEVASIADATEDAETDSELGELSTESDHAVQDVGAESADPEGTVTLRPVPDLTVESIRSESESSLTDSAVAAEQIESDQPQSENGPVLRVVTNDPVEEGPK